MARLSWTGVILVVAGIAFLVIVDVFTDFGSARGDQIVSLLAAVALLVVIGGGALGAYRGQRTMALQHIAIWLAIIAAIALIYNYRAALGFNF